jgi:hypothetical protein
MLIRCIPSIRRTTSRHDEGDGHVQMAVEVTVDSEGGNDAMRPPGKRKSVWRGEDVSRGVGE